MAVFRSNPFVYDLLLPPGAATTIEFGPVSVYTFIQVATPSLVNVLLNSNPAATLQMNKGSGQMVFHHNDLPLTSLTFANMESGAGPANILVITNEVPN